MNKVLIIDPKVLKENTVIDQNTAGEFILPSVRLAQEIDLVEIIGECLYSEIVRQISEGAVKPEYKELIDNYIIPFLEYASLVRLIPMVQYKVCNAGVVTTNDEHITNETYANTRLLQDEYNNIRNTYKKRLQDFLKKHRVEYPELKDCCGSNLNSSSDCPIWLGGGRGRKIVPSK